MYLQSNEKYILTNNGLRIKVGYLTTEPFDFPPLSGEFVRHEPADMLFRVVASSIVYGGITYTQGQELSMPRDTAMENNTYRGKVERVSGFDI